MMHVYNAFVNVKVLVKGPMDTINALRYKSPVAAKVRILNVLYICCRQTDTVYYRFFIGLIG